jgi:ribosomal protein S18 acetylase RimI-like enzyme
MPVATVIRLARPEDAAGIVRVHGDTWWAAYRGIVPDAFLERFAREPDAVERRRRWLEKPESVTLVAEEGGEVVGFAAGGRTRGGPPEYDAELYAIYVLPSHQRGGLGRRLARAFAAAAAAQGFRALVLWVLRDNARGRVFYESLGGRLVAEKPIDLGGATLFEVAYGWPDLKALASPAAQ